MIYRLILLAAGFMCGVTVAHAQTIEDFKSRLSAPVISENGLSQSDVTATEHGDAARIVAEASHASQRLRLHGYRVCIFFDNGTDARAGAVAARDLFASNFPGVKSYMVYENPYFKVSVGNCLTSEEAVILKGKVDGLFPKAFVKNEELSISDLLD